MSYLVHVDESGDENGVIHAGLMVPIEKWSGQLGVWLKYRKWMYEKYGVPASYHLHSHKWLSGEGVPVPDEPEALINTSRPLRRDIFVKGLKSLARAQDLTIFSHRSSARSVASNYAGFLGDLDDWLEGEGDHAIVIIDGGKEGSPVADINHLHRSLPRTRRRIVEDAWHQPAETSQLVQAADVVAHALFRGWRNAPTDPGRNWFAEYLHDSEVACGCPRNADGP